MSGTSNSCINLGQGCRTATDFPQFIDTAACLCGLLLSREPSPNGNRVEKWRCIGDANKDVGSGGTGKWFNTTLPSEELAGRAQAQNWGENPPDTSEAFVLVDDRGQRKYERLGSDGSPQLIDNDGDCIGENDTMLSGRYYENGRNPSSSSSSLALPSSTPSSASSTSVSAPATSSSSPSSTESSASAPATSSSSPSSTESSASPSNTSDSPATLRLGLKAVMLMGMLLAPIVAMMA